ncbi:MAG: transpeptidase family protein [Chlorobi bacterium]|nr:transpeptidase family protein [Chlorobiota bacterium]
MSSIKLINIKKDILWRVYLVYFFVLLFALLIVGKIIYIQVKEGDELRALAKTQELKVFTIDANRGNILDDKGNLLATSVPVFEIRMDVASPNIPDALFNQNVDALAAGLARVIGQKTRQQYKAILVKNRKKGRRYVWLGSKVTYDQLKELRKLPVFNRGRNAGGLIVNQTPRRELPFKELAARTIGFESGNKKYLVGLEGAYSDILSGKNGQQVKRRINHGDWVPVYDENDVEPRDGLDLQTTIDINIQDIAENALLRQLLNHKAFQGCAVVMEVKTGKIKAIANLTYDSTDGKYKESYNYAIGASIEPGSTFKLPNILVAIEKGNVKLTDSVITGVGFEVIHGVPVQDVHKIKTGRITVRDVFEHSSNVGMAKIITRTFAEKPKIYTDALYEMGLNRPLGIDIKGEGRPLIKSPEDKDWWGTTLTVMAYGYEIRQTPLQTLTFYNAIANDGKMVKPRFVEAIKVGDEVKERFETEVINPQVVSPETVKIGQSLLEGVVSEGTAKNSFKNCGYKVAGKTGTAKIASGGKYRRDYNATFVGYFPADDPKYSCIVSINRPTNGKYYGGSVAAPAFREISDKLYATTIALHVNNQLAEVDVPPPMPEDPVAYDDLQDIYAELNIKAADLITTENWAVANNEEGQVIIEPADDQFKRNVVPDVRGMKAKDAVFLLENKGLKTRISGRGFVRSQSVRPGTPLTKGRVIKLQLAVY